MSDEDSVRLDMFSPDQVARLAGITRSQLAYWNKTGFFGSEEHPGGRYYSFRDVVALRAIGMMRNVSHVSLHTLRRVGEWLHDNEQKWWSTVFFVAGHRVYWDDPVTGSRFGDGTPNQTEMPIEMVQVRAEVGDAIRDQRARKQEEVGQLSSRRGVAGGALVIAGTRIPVTAIQEFHAAGYSTQEIRREYPELTEADVEAAIAAVRKAG